MGFRYNFGTPQVTIHLLNQNSLEIFCLSNSIKLGTSLDHVINANHWSVFHTKYPCFVYIAYIHIKLRQENINIKEPRNTHLDSQNRIILKKRSNINYKSGNYFHPSLVISWDHALFIEWIKQNIWIKIHCPFSILAWCHGCNLLQDGCPITEEDKNPKDDFVAPYMSRTITLQCSTVITWSIFSQNFTKDTP